MDGMDGSAIWLGAGMLAGEIHFTISRAITLQSVVAELCNFDALHFANMGILTLQMVGCVITRGRKVWGVEVKLSQSVSRSDTKGLRRLAEHAKKDFQAGIVFYGGEDILPLGEKWLLAVPISKLWKL